MKDGKRELWVVVGGECLDCGLRNALTVVSLPRRHKHYGFRLSSKCQGCGGSGQASIRVLNLEQLISSLSRRRVRPLTEKQRFVLSLRYGVKDGNSYTLQEIADLMGITRQMAKKHEDAAIKKIENVISRTKKTKETV